jgi:diamine N-acetyltransferase
VTGEEMAAFAIRRGVAADARALAEFGARTFMEAFAADNTAADMALHLGRTFGAARQAAELADPERAYLVAEATDRLIGYALVADTPPPACVRGTRPIELLRLYVERDWFGTGLAQALIAETEREAMVRGGDTLWLGVWERNPRAIAFYRKCSFVEVGSHVFRLGDDEQTDRVMQKALRRRGRKSDPGRSPGTP